MDLSDKQKKIAAITDQQVALLKKSIALAKKPPCKTVGGVMRRALKIVGYTVQARILNKQKNIIIAIPNNGFPRGASVVHTNGPEKID